MLAQTVRQRIFLHSATNSYVFVKIFAIILLLYNSSHITITISSTKYVEILILILKISKHEKERICFYFGCDALDDRSIITTTTPTDSNISGA